MSSEGWVSVKDKLPANGEYLCLGHGGMYFICLRRGGRWLRQSAAKAVVGITHWMFLPPHPKENQS